MRITQKYLTELGYQIVGCAIEVHKHLGPGLLESVYETCFVYELKQKGFEVQSQIWVPIYYKEEKLGSVLKLDLLINNLIVVEIKAVETMIKLYQSQLLSYLYLTDKPKGLLINFNSENITKNVVPLVTKEFSMLPKE